MTWLDFFKDMTTHQIQTKRTYQISQLAAPALWHTGGWYCESTLQTGAGGPAWGWWGLRCWWDPSPPAGGEPGCWNELGRWSQPCSPAWSTRSDRALSSHSPTHKSPAHWNAVERYSSPGERKSVCFNCWTGSTNTYYLIQTWHINKVIFHFPADCHATELPLLYLGYRLADVISTYMQV